MTNLDAEAAKILSVFLEYEKRITPKFSIWIRLSFIPLALIVFLTFIHRFLNFPYYALENIFFTLIPVLIQIICLGSIIQTVFFTRSKNEEQIMMDWFSLGREYSLKIKDKSSEGIHHFSEYLDFNLKIREKKIDLNLVGSAALTGLFLGLTRVDDIPIQKVFILLSALAVVATITFIRDRKLLVQLRRFEDLLRKLFLPGDESSKEVALPSLQKKPTSTVEPCVTASQAAETQHSPT